MSGSKIECLQTWNQCCGFKYIEFRSGSRILTPFGSGYYQVQKKKYLLSVESLNCGFISLNLIPIASMLSYMYSYMSGSVFGIRIRIHKAPEYGSNTDPDPQHCLKQNQRVGKVVGKPNLQIESKPSKTDTGYRYNLLPQIFSNSEHQLSYGYVMMLLLLCRYCGPMCQQRDWATHKRVCREKRRIFPLSVHQQLASPDRQTHPSHPPHSLLGAP